MRQYRLTCPLVGLWAPALCTLLMLFLSPAALGQNAAGAAPAVTEPLTTDQVQSAIAALDSGTGLPDDAKQRVLDLYNQALEQLRLDQEWSVKAAGFDKAIQEVPSRMAQAEENLTGAEDAPHVDIPKDATLLDLEQGLAQAESDLGAAKTAQDELQKEPARRAERARKLPELISDAMKRLEDAQAQLTASPPPDEPAEATAARDALNRARVQAIESEKLAYEKEMASYRADGGLLLLQQDAAAAKVSRSESNVQRWRDIVADRREEELQKATREAQQALLDTAKAGPAVRTYAEQIATENKDLIAQRTGADGIVRQIDEAQSTLDQLDAQFANVRASLEDVKAKTAAAGPSVALGLLLRNTLAGLPDPRKLRQEIRDRTEEIARVQLDLIELPEQRANLLARENSLNADAPEADEAQLRILRDLLSTQRGYLNDLINDHDTYVNILLSAQLKEQQLMEATRSLASFIHERIMWVKSTHAFQASDLRASWSTVLWFLAPGNWRDLLTALAGDALVSAPLYLFALAVFVCLLWVARKSALGLDALGEEAKRHLSLSFTPTFKALLLTVLLAIPWPAVLWFSGWRFTTIDSDFARAAGSGLRSAAFVLLILGLTRRAVRQNGLADAHFDWPSGVLKALRKHLPWLTVLWLLFVFLISFMEDYGDDVSKNSLGRVFFFGAAAAYAVFAHILLRAKKGAAYAALRLFYDKRGEHLCRVAHAVNLGVPLTLILLAGFGYYYTALRLNWRVFDTAALVLALLLIRGMVFRALRLAQNRHYREKQAKATREGASATEKGEEQAEINWGEIDNQTKHLVASVVLTALVLGAWVIWADVLPALGVLNRVELWNTTQNVTETTKDVAGNLVSSSHEQVVPVTLAHIFLGTLLLVMTVVLVKNLPGLLEVVLLSRLAMVPGERYAITSVVRYLLMLLGALTVFQVIGIGWSKVQWLVAAMGVGLGFGLQEIFANFISGLIILFERPIRLGDTVTIGGISGTVTQIRMRATRIMDWDRKELIVPNKEFVTGQLVNWTLSDPMLRVIIPVGIAYGSDTQQAVRTLERVAKAHPLVMEEPAPQVLFMKFGASSLDFELRVYCPGVEHLLGVRHDLHMAIDQAFREAGIKIAFPQQDIHLRSVEADVPIKMHRDTPPD